jgi:hypothetical protein
MGIAKRENYQRKKAPLLGIDSAKTTYGERPVEIYSIRDQP